MQVTSTPEASERSSLVAMSVSEGGVCGAGSAGEVLVPVAERAGRGVERLHTLNMLTEILTNIGINSAAGDLVARVICKLLFYRRERKRLLYDRC